MAANMSPLIMRIVSASVAVSNRASKIIRDVLSKGDLGTVQKAKNDFQTEADRSAQRCIMASLHKHFPKVYIIGEEELEPEAITQDYIESGFNEEVLKHECPDFLKNVNDEDVVIWVDPLDGTAEYTQGFLDHVTVLIGVAWKGHAVAGVINQPFYNYQSKDKEMGRCIWGVCQLGAFGFTREKLPKDKLLVTTSRSHSNRMVTEAVEAYNPTEIVRVGGAGHKVLLLIEGKVHAYVFATKGCKRWDTCAPEAILHAVGGKLTDMFGEKMDYGPKVRPLNAGGVLATTSNHQYFVHKVPENILEMLEKSTPPKPLENGLCLDGDNDRSSSDVKKSAKEEQSSKSYSPRSESPSNSSVASTEDTKL